jgi:HK97 family phage portal protein
MSIFGSIKRLLGPRNDISSAEIKRGDGVWESLGGNTGGAPSEPAALRVTAVHGCVQLIAGAISSMPMHVYNRASDGDLKRDINAPLWWVLNEEFSPRWLASAGWSYLVASKLLHGDGFAEIIRTRNGDIKGLTPIHPRRVEVIASPDGMRLVYKVQPDTSITRPSEYAARIRTIDQDDMLHIPGFGFDGLRGMSALRNALSVSGRLAISAQDFSSSFLQNLGRPDFALTNEGNLTDAQFSRLQDTITQHQGPMNSGKPMILEGGLKIEALTMPLEEMQLLETRKFQVEEICRVFGVPPFMIGHTTTTSAWGTGVQAMGAGFVRFALRDHLNAFQNEINRKFFRTASRVAEFDTTELERGDIKSMMETVRIGLGRAGEPPIISEGEGRHMLRLPFKIEGKTSPVAAPPEPTTADAPDAPDVPDAPGEDMPDEQTT